MRPKTNAASTTIAMYIMRIGLKGEKKLQVRESNPLETASRAAASIHSANLQRMIVATAGIEPTIDTL